MTEEGLTLRDLKKQERLEKRGGAVAQLPNHFHERAGKLKLQLQEALAACGPTETSRYLDLHEDLQKLEGLMREITVTRERKLLLAAHEAVSGLSPDLKYIKDHERPFYEDLKRVLASHRQRVFAGTEAPPVMSIPLPTSPEGGSLPIAVPESPETPETPPLPETTKPKSPTTEEEALAGPVKPAELDRTADPADQTEKADVPSTPSAEAEKPAETEDLHPHQAASPETSPATLEPQKEQPEPSAQEPAPDPGSYQVVRVLENLQPFTGIDARVYSLKAQDVVSLPSFNAQRLAEVGIVAHIGGPDEPVPEVPPESPEGEG